MIAWRCLFVSGLQNRRWWWQGCRVSKTPMDQQRQRRRGADQGNIEWISLSFEQWRGTLCDGGKVLQCCAWLLLVLIVDMRDGGKVGVVPDCCGYSPLTCVMPECCGCSLLICVMLECCGCSPLICVMPECCGCSPLICVMPDCCWCSPLTCVMVASLSVLCMVAVGAHHRHVWWWQSLLVCFYCWPFTCVMVASLSVWCLIVVAAHC